jgi:predicted esterase YcpF (UPF0227 family)
VSAQGTPASAPSHVLYLHGFRSSPQSFKARLLHAWLNDHRPDVHWWCPQLPPSPREAMQLVSRGIEGWPPGGTAVIGSSLGGFYATAVAEPLGCRAVLLNPAVHPARDLAAYIGEQTAFHDPDERFFFKREYVAELHDLTLAAITPGGRWLVIIAKGDEVLDWREMHARYAGCRVQLLEGGDHALSDFEHAHLPSIVKFLELEP